VCSVLCGVEMMTVTVSDRGSPSLSSSADVNITVIDVNDHRPQFVETSYEASVREDAAVGQTVREDAVVGQTVLTLRAVDADEGLNAQLEYLLIDDVLPRSPSHFNVDRSTGALTVAEPLDFEETSLFSLDVTVRDCGHYRLSQHITVVVFVLDTNDHKPTIKLHPQLSSSSVGGLETPLNEVEVSEHARPGSSIAHLSVHDRDSADNGRVSCFLGGFDVGGLFALRRFHHGQYGLVVSGGRRLDHERRRRYDVVVTCADHGQPPAVSALAVSVVVTDENDHDPEFPVNPVVTSSDGGSSPS